MGKPRVGKCDAVDKQEFRWEPLMLMLILQDIRLLVLAIGLYKNKKKCKGVMESQCSIGSISYIDR